MTRRRPWLLIAALALGAPGLAAQTATTQPAEAPEAKTEAKAGTTPLVVTLVEAGAGPRRPMRFRPKAGATETIEMTIGIEAEQSMGGMTIPSQKRPAMKYALQLSITDVDAAGDITYAFKYEKAEIVEDPEVDPFTAETTRNALKAIEGLHGTGIMTSRGYKTVKFERTPDMDPMLLQQIEGMETSMEQLVSPFPAEPIGVGAVWKVEGSVEQQGMLIHQTVTMRLKGAEGNRLEVEAAIVQDADDQKLEQAGMPPMTLKSYQAKGDVASVLSLDRLFPVSSTTKLTYDTILVIENMGPEQEYQQRTVLTSDLTSK
jgi:hypothetical protein